jgi:HlyD family secretion protein
MNEPLSRGTGTGVAVPAAAPARARPRWHWRLGLSAAAALLCLLAAAFWVSGRQGETLDLVGVVERKNVELVAPVLEEIVERPVAIGQPVAAGQVVIRLNNEVAELELQAAEASRAAAMANLSQLQQEFARSEGLTLAHVTARRDLDVARRGRDEAAAVLAERNARVAQARKRLRDLTVVSKVDGVVDQLPYEVGERVPAGSVLAVVLARENPWVRVWLPVRAMSRIRAGMPARVVVSGLDGALEGRLQDIGRVPEFTPHYALTERERDHLVYESRVVLLGAPADLRPGLPATVSLPLGSAAAAAPPAPGSAPPASAPLASAPPASAPPASAPLASAPPASAPLASAPPAPHR